MSRQSRLVGRVDRAAWETPPLHSSHCQLSTHPSMWRRSAVKSSAGLTASCVSSESVCVSLQCCVSERAQRFASPDWPFSAARSINRHCTLTLLRSSSQACSRQRCAASVCAVSSAASQPSKSRTRHADLRWNRAESHRAALAVDEETESAAQRHATQRTNTAHRR